MATDLGGECDLCGRPLPGDGGEADGVAFCCSGCRDVYDAVGGVDSSLEQDSRAVAGAGPDGTYDRTFLRVDGMHRSTCEAFLESVATDRDGVYDAEASYVTETIRVGHDPDRISDRDLRDALSTAGYTAYLRDDAGTNEEGGGGTTRRSREMTGLRKRRTDDTLEGRHVAGIVFGTFLLLQYGAILYPRHLPFVYDDAVGRIFEDALASSAGTMFFLLLFTLTGFVLYFTGAPLLRGAYVSLKTRRANADLLVALTAVGALGYSTIGVALGRTRVYYDLAAIVVIVAVSATYYEATVKRRAMDRLTELTVSQVDAARRLEDDGTTVEVPTEEVDAGDRVLVREGERIPVDGVLEDGECTVDEAVVTGENLPVVKREGDGVVGGSLVRDGAAVIGVGDDPTSSIDGLTSAVWNLQSADHGVQRRADRVAVAVVPPLALLTIAAGATALALGGSLGDALLVALLVPVVTSPWALGLATPLSVATSIREATERGVVVFDETVFERLREIDVVVFDKTGTLTTGRMDVVETDAPRDLLEAAAALERRATHPAAEAIVAAFGATADRGVRTDGGRRRVDSFGSLSRGVEGTVDDDDVLVGHPALFAERGWSVTEEIEARASAARDAGRLPVVVGRNGTAEGVVVVGDEPREGWVETVTGLTDRGIETVVLTGDGEAASAFLARHRGVDRVLSGVPPEGKTAAIRGLKADGRVAMVGDGTNDAPALAEADLGISLGSGTALASDAADLAIATDDLGSVETAFDLSVAARRRLERNVGLALVYNAVTVPLAVAGLLNPFLAAGAAAVSCALIAANSSRDLVDG